ncbi:GFA family protein [Peredibacter sp. HCB2-198]|uniref:GFA family protein n=1 Tax=Peredibacter sp. HCB2-198 TaxID=3383025 RepID=UPI0038B43D30
MYSGSCLCGKIKYEVVGDFESFFLCHCKYCQKDSGSAHTANLFSTTASLKWISGKDTIKTFNLPGTRHSKSFCPECSSGIPALQMEGKLLVVPAGSLDTQIGMKPNAHIFCSSRASWDHDMESLDQFETFPQGQL